MHVAKLFLGDILSGDQTQKLVQKATRAGAAGVGDLAKAGASGKCPKQKLKG